MRRKAVNIDELPADTPLNGYGFPTLPQEEGSGVGGRGSEGAPIQRIIGGYLPIAGMPGWFTREMTLRQEIELTDMAEELQALATAADAKPSQAIRAALPIAQLVIFRRNPDGDYMPASRDDLLDNFRTAVLMEIVRNVSGFGEAGAGDPTAALPITS